MDINNRIDVELLKLGINNNRKIIVNWNFDSLDTVDDIEILTIIMGILERLKLKLDIQIDEIEDDSENNEDF